MSYDDPLLYGCQGYVDFTPKKRVYKLTEQEVFAAFNERRATRDGAWSGYIADEVRMRHAKAIRNGFTGHEPSRALILRRLQSLAAKGFLERSDGTNGYYGYYWSLTEAGLSHLRTEPASPLNQEGV